MATTDLSNPIYLPNGIDTANENPIAKSDKIIRQGKGHDVEVGLTRLEDSILGWNFSTQTSGLNPGSGNLAFNNAVKDNATVINFNSISAIHNARFDEFLSNLSLGTRIFIQSRTTFNTSILFRVTGTPTLDGTRVDVPVVRERDQGLEFTSGEFLNVSFLAADIEATEVTASSFDNEYSTALSSQSISSETFVVFTAEPDTSGSDHSDLNTDTTRVDITEAGFYNITVNLTVQNTTSTANDRLVPDIKLYKVRGGVSSVEAEESSYIRATTADGSPLAPNSLEFTLGFESALEVNDQIRVSIQARTGSVSTTGAIQNGALVIRRLEFTGNVSSVSDTQILQTINSLPSTNPNFYYERLTSTSGLATPSTTHTIIATGDGTEFDIIPTRTSVGGILADIPFENLFQGQLELQSDVACSLEIEGRFTHFEGQPAAFTTPRTLRIDLQAGIPHTEELNGFNSEVIVPLGTVPLPGGGDITVDEELLAAPFPYRLEWRLKAFQLGSTTTRIAANISGFRLLSHAIIFKQANRIIGPQGPAGPSGPSATVSALASRDILTEPSSPPSASATAQSFTLTIPDTITNIGEYAFIEIGTSRLVAGQISYNIISADTLQSATSSNPLYVFPTGTSGADYLGSTYSIYLSSPTTLVYRAGSNRAFLRRVTGINIGATSTPDDTWNIQNNNVTADAVSGTNTPLPSGALEFYAYRISNDGFLFSTAVTAGDWLLALQDSPITTDLTQWDIISGDRFPVSSTLFHFSDQITEATVNNSQQFTLSDFFQLREGNFPTPLIDRFTQGGTTDISSIRSKVDALYPLTPNVDKLNDWADLFTPATATQTVDIITGYDLLADFRGTTATDHYESAGITYDDTGTNVVRYSGLGTNIFRQFGFKVNAVAQVDTITLTGTSGTANINVNSVNYLATFTTSLTVSATNFVSTHATALDAAGITVTSSGADLIFTAKTGGTAFTIAAPVNATGDLAGTLANTTTGKTLLSIVDGGNIIPFVDTTSSGTFRINNFIPAQSTSEVITNQFHQLPRSAGSDVVSTTPGSVSTHIIPNFPAGATSTSRTLQIGIDVYLNGSNTSAEHVEDVAIPASNTAQAKRTFTASPYLGPLYGNRTVNVTIGYEYRVDGANLVVDLTLESAPSDITVSFIPDTVALLNYTSASVVARQDRWQTFTDAGGNYTFTGEQELIIHFRPAIGTDGQPTGILETVGASIGAAGSATQLNDNDIDQPTPLWETVEIPDDIEFRTFGSNHFFRHSDLASLLQGRATKWVYGLALLREISEHKITGELEFDSFILISPNSSRYRVQVENDGTLKTTLVV